MQSQVPQDSGFGFTMLAGTSLIKCAYEVSSLTDSHSDKYFICSISNNKMLCQKFTYTLDLCGALPLFNYDFD